MLVLDFFPANDALLLLLDAAGSLAAAALLLKITFLNSTLFRLCANGKDFVLTQFLTFGIQAHVLLTLALGYLRQTRQTFLSPDSSTGKACQAFNLICSLLAALKLSYLTNVSVDSSP